MLTIGPHPGYFGPPRRRQRLQRRALVRVQFQARGSEGGRTGEQNIPIRIGQGRGRALNASPAMVIDYVTVKMLTNVWDVRSALYSLNMPFTWSRPSQTPSPSESLVLGSPASGFADKNV
jgi:hypothetical protein